MGKNLCSENLSGEHEPDEAELASIDAEEEIAIIRFVCALCGGEGTFNVPLEDIKWEEPEDEEIED
jgi:hypothetical protein